MTKRIPAGLLLMFLLSLLTACTASTPAPPPTNPPATTSLATTSAATTSPAGGTKSATTATSTTAATATGATSTTAAVATTAASTTAAVATTSAASPSTRIPNSPTATPIPQARVKLSGYAGKLAYISNEADLFIDKFDGQGPQQLKNKAAEDLKAKGGNYEYSFPGWSKDGKQLALTALTSRNGFSSEVVIANLDNNEFYNVLEDIAGGIIYTHWSPDGKSITALISASPILELVLVEVKKGVTATTNFKQLAKGNPLYSTWSADASKLVVHSNAVPTSKLERLDPKAASINLASVDVATGNYRAPAYSPSGARLVYSVVDGSVETLIFQDADGKPQGRLITQGTNAAFNWSPSGKYMAHTIAGKRAGVYEGLYVSDVSATAANSSYKSEAVIQERVVAFFWSPDSTKLAWVGYNAAGSLLVWNIYDIATRKNTPLAEFYPSDLTGQLFGFFDQYAQSDSIWSPDSKALAFSGWEQSVAGLDKRPNLNASIYVLPVDGPKAGQPQNIGGGELALWSPRP